MSNLWQQTSYKSKVTSLIDRSIREFDITKANINVLRDANVISQDTYAYLMQCPKLERQIYIGKLQGSDTRVSTILKDGIANARRIFIQENNIEDHEILAIRNDAIVIVGSKPIRFLNITERVAFREADKYTSYYNIKGLDFYYFCDIVNEVEKLDIKGLGNEAIKLHKDYMLELLCTLFYCAQIENIQDAITLLENVHMNYINRSLSVEYYRELNAQSKYKLMNEFSTFSTVYIDSASEYEKLHYLDISRNESIMRELNSIFASAYFGKR